MLGRAELNDHFLIKTIPLAEDNLKYIYCIPYSRLKLLANIYSKSR